MGMKLYPQKEVEVADYQGCIRVVLAGGTGILLQVCTESESGREVQME